MSPPWETNADVCKFEFVSILCNPGHHRSNSNLNDLSVSERLKVFKEIAGSSELTEEDPNEIVSLFDKVDVELRRITNKAAFDVAMKQSPLYVANPRWLLMFLRGNDYDPLRTATMLVHHFEEKLALFGEEKLTKDIEISDLSEDDMYSLKAGGAQIASVRDRYGRLLIFLRYAEYRWKHYENQLRAVWYLKMAALSDEDVQRHGVVVVAYEVGGDPPPMDFELLRREMYQLKCLPVKAMACHFCTSTHTMMRALDLVIHMSTPFFRVRLRAHHGEETEVMYQLMTFGIPVYAVPWVAGRDKNHERWIEDRKRIENGPVSERKEAGVRWNLHTGLTMGLRRGTMIMEWGKTTSKKTLPFQMTFRLDSTDCSLCSVSSGVS